MFKWFYFFFKSHTGRKISLLDCNVELIIKLDELHIYTTHLMHVPPPHKDYHAIVVTSGNCMNCKLCYICIKKVKTGFICKTCYLPLSFSKMETV